MAEKENPTKPGIVFTKTIEQGPNKGDRVQFRVAPGGHPYPIRVLHDRGGDSTLRNDGIPFGKTMRAFRKGKLKKGERTVNDLNEAVDIAGCALLFVFINFDIIQLAYLVTLGSASEIR